MDHERFDMYDKEHPAHKAVFKNLKANFMQLENEAFENVMSHDAAVKEFNYDKTTLIVCKRIASGDKTGEVWKVTVTLDKRIADPGTGMPLKTIELEPLQNTGPDQTSYEYNTNDNSLWYMTKIDDAKGLSPVVTRLEANQVVKLCELLNKGESLDAKETLSEKQPPPRFTRILRILKGQA